MLNDKTRVTFTVTSKSSLINKMHVLVSFKIFMQFQDLFLNFQNLQIKCKENLQQLQMDIKYRSNFECTLGTAEGQKVYEQICTLYNFPFLFLFYLSSIHLHQLEFSSLDTQLTFQVMQSESNYWGPYNTTSAPAGPAQ